MLITIITPIKPSRARHRTDQRLLVTWWKSPRGQPCPNYLQKHHTHARSNRVRSLFLNKYSTIEAVWACQRSRPPSKFLCQVVLELAAITMIMPNNQDLQMMTTKTLSMKISKSLKPFKTSNSKTLWAIFSLRHRQIPWLTICLATMMVQMMMKTTRIKSSKTRTMVRNS